MRTGRMGKCWRETQDMRNSWWGKENVIIWRWSSHRVVQRAVGTLFGFADNLAIVDTQRGQINRKNDTSRRDGRAYRRRRICILIISRKSGNEPFRPILSTSDIICSYMSLANPMRNNFRKFESHISWVWNEGIFSLGEDESYQWKALGGITMGRGWRLSCVNVGWNGRIGKSGEMWEN